MKLARPPLTPLRWEGLPVFFEDENDSFTPLYFTDRERCPKKPFPDPSKIGELTAEEKKLIALLRASQKVSADEAAMWVQQQRKDRHDS